MDECQGIGFNAMEHIRVLAGQIGPRPAGSQAEKEALDYTAEQLIRYGYNPEWMDVPFTPAPLYELSNLAAGVVLAASGWLWPALPVLTLATPLIMLLIPELENWGKGARKKSILSQNVFAVNEGKADDPLLIFCAHVDTAPAMAIDAPWLVRLTASGMHIMQRVAILISLLSLVLLLGFYVPASIYPGVGICASVIGLWFASVDLVNQLDRRKGFSPGAVDNGSGAGMALALAEVFAENPPKRLRLGFLFTGAEEPGLFGADAFVKSRMKGAGKTAIFNLDMVGAGKELQVVSRVGSLISYSTQKDLNELLFDIWPQAKGVWYSLKSGDFQPFLKGRYDAVSIQTAGSGPADVSYHTRNDMVKNIQVETLEWVGNICCQFVEMLPYSGWALKDQK